ncbi:MAG: UDP-glucose 4-epimerase GalE [Pseudomonadota bacterium]
MKKILVVGGAGYIGSQLVLEAEAAGLYPIIFDNLSRGHRKAVGQYPLVVGDLRDAIQIKACLSEHSVEAVFHFAALAYVGESVREPSAYYQNNVAGTLNLLDAMQASGVKQLIFSSTCATYGEPEYLPINESHPQRPINPYGHSKLIIEQVLRDMAVAEGLNSVSLRYFNAAGADPQGRTGECHDPETHLLPLVLQEAMRVKQGGLPEETQLVVHGLDLDTPDGSCVRDYVHVADLCQAHLLALEALQDGRLHGASAFNLANHRGYSVLEVIDCCRRVTRQDIRYRAGQRRPGDPGCLIGQAQAAKELLGWQPLHSDLEIMVQTAWNWMNRK